MSKEKRDRLFKRGRPVIRPFQVFDGEKYHKDLGIAWVAYQKNKFHDAPEGLTSEQFVQWIIGLDLELMVAEDVNTQFNGGVGPIGLIGVWSNGWKMEPHVEFYPWASDRNKLASSVAFFQMVRYKKIGCCVVYCQEDSVSLFDKCVDYGVLHKSGKIANGDPRGDQYIYSVRGKKNG